MMPVVIVVVDLHRVAFPIPNPVKTPINKSCVGLYSEDRACLERFLITYNSLIIIMIDSEILLNNNNRSKKYMIRLWTTRQDYVNFHYPFHNKGIW